MGEARKRKARQVTPRRDGVAVAPARNRPDWQVLLILLVAILVAYQRVWHCGFIWDDDAHVTRPDLLSLHGLARIWTEPGATQQYYPVLFSAFWIENRIWGYSALGYHLATVVLHALASFLLYRVLRFLSVPGALLAAALFALHPVCVESVAWISEQKNTLSAVFYLAAGLAYLRFDARRSPHLYAVGTLLFVLALLSKSVTATLPAALLVIAWWRRGRISWRSDVAPLVPWLAMGAAAGSFTSWVERTYVGAGGAGELGPVERLLVAGRALGFYLGKLLWPADLVFIYPRWTVDAHSVGQALFPAAAIAVLAVLFAVRRRTRGPLAAALLFAGTLAPALGFVDVYPFRFSYVADHFQYLGAAVALSGFAALFSLATARLRAGARLLAHAAACCVVVMLGVVTWRQTSIYANLGTLWQDTISRNPGCWMAYNNLGRALMADGQVDAAMDQYSRALDLNPGFEGPHNNLGVALMAKGRALEAIAHFKRAIEIEPADVESHNNLGMALRKEGRLGEAIAQYRIALEAKPKDLDATYNLGNALLQAGRVDEAITCFRNALEISPDLADAHNNLGNAYRRLGRTEEARAEYKRVLEIEPGNERALRNLESLTSPGLR